MNLTPLWVSALSAAGHEAVLWSGLGRADAPDSIIMNYAEVHGMVVFTEDLDFGILLARMRRQGPSVVQVRLGENLPRQIGARVLEALRQAEAELLAGALVSIDPKRNRVSLLPLG